ncbi:GNAT family N-acetyltransferase [Hymenobacter metallicola]|uniref:N-acetyltransferase n=1 Tax=Hymenobacter metallicola TaxID=2563114 RepID=A0A4Z0PVT1_9BACT|nr:GNAT family N-acetyltransferase [Hymenobacter metallicola]TGE20963.1 N-acetyltransferase [Hymenobacter metallicola]
MLKTSLFDSYTVAEVDADQWQAVFTLHQARVFPHEHEGSSLAYLLSVPESTRLDQLRQNLNGARHLYFLLLDGDEPVGWHYGFQRSELEYFMANTGVLPEYQNRGLYSAFLKFIVQHAADLGFQYLTSIHHSDNNAVLVPKLKAGFVLQAFGYLIQTMLLDASVGPMVQLVYPTKDEYRRFLGFQRGVPSLNSPPDEVG